MSQKISEDGQVGLVYRSGGKSHAVALTAEQHVLLQAITPMLGTIAVDKKREVEFSDKLRDKKIEISLLLEKISWYKKLDIKIKKILNSELEVEDYETEVFHKIEELEDKLEELEFELEDEDES